MIWLISWKNIWRNRMRSIILLISIFLGVFAGVFSTAFFNGMVNQRVENVIKIELSHVQVHFPEYLETFEPGKYIPDGDKVRKYALEMGEVKAVSNRVISFAMASSAETGSGVKITGVNPHDEMQVSNLYKKIIDGKYFEGVKSNPIVIGQKLAEKLKVKVRSKLVLTLQQLDGTITYGAFRVAGIYKTVNTSYDEMNAYVRDTDLLTLIKMRSGVCHEIAVLLNSNEATDNVSTILANHFKNYEVLNWKQLSPEMRLLEEGMGAWMYFFMGIILLALLFGIINTMLMVVLERVKELGMLMAIGMNKTRVFLMIMLETVYISLFGGVIGIFVGYMVSVYFARKGIDLYYLYGKGFEAYGYDAVIFPYIDFQMALQLTIMILIAALVASVYPARKALKLNPAEAIRTDI